jgi:hypothetical protein
MATAPRWTRDGEVAWVEDDGRVALLDLGHLERPPVILQASSAVIWELLGDGLDEQRLVESVAEVYGVPTAEVAGPVHDFLRRMQELQLVRRDDGG